MFSVPEGVTLIPVDGSDRPAIVDTEDAERVRTKNWTARPSGGKLVPVGYIKGSQIRLARFVMQGKATGGVNIRTRNGDPFDCRKANLSREISPVDQSRSWESRRPPGLVRLLSSKDAVVPPPPPECSHPVLITGEFPGFYACARCDKQMKLLTTGDKTFREVAMDGIKALTAVHRGSDERARIIYAMNILTTDNFTKYRAILEPSWGNPDESDALTSR